MVPVVQERNTVIVPAQIHGQLTEDEGAATLDHVKRRGVVTISHVQVQVSCESDESITLHNVLCYYL